MVTTPHPPVWLPLQAYICVCSCCVRGPVFTHTPTATLFLSLLPKEAFAASFCNIRAVSPLHHPRQRTLMP